MIDVDGVSETTRAILRRNPHRLPRPTESCGATTSADHYRDLALARQYTSATRHQAGLTLPPMPGHESHIAHILESQELPRWPEEPEPAVVSKKCIAVRPPATHNLLGYGDTEPAVDSFPGAPAASRGLPSGTQSRWSFERIPSLLHGPMERDRGMIGRQVAGLPPSAISVPPMKMMSRDPMMRMTRVSPRNAASTSSLFTGMHGLIGMGWDTAKTPAGSARAGAGGRFLGF